MDPFLASILTSVVVGSFGLLIWIIKDNTKSVKENTRAQILLEAKVQILTERMDSLMRVKDDVSFLHKKLRQIETDLHLDLK